MFFLLYFLTDKEELKQCVLFSQSGSQSVEKHHLEIIANKQAHKYT